MTRRRKLLLFVGLAVVVVAAVAAQIARGRDKAVEVRIETVGRRDLVATVTASGQIAPKTAVDVASDITGRIIGIAVKEGDYVQRGQLLLRIDPTTYEAAKARAEANLSAMQAQALRTRVDRDQAKRALDRYIDLRTTDSNLVAAEQFEQAQQVYEVAAAVAESQEYQVRQAEAGLREAEDNLSKTVLRAPMTGQVTRLEVEEGEVALASTFSRETGLLMTISDLSVIQVNVRVDETDVVRLDAGDSAEITIDAFPDTTFVGRVTEISRSAIRAASASTDNNADRAVDYDVEITLDNPPPGIRPDLSATSKIITDTRTGALSIPIIALTVRQHRPISTEEVPRDTSRAETEGVFVVSGGVADFRPVRVGIAGEEHFEVLSGLVEGDSIVAGPYQTIRDLQDSALVKPMKTEGTPGRGEAVAATPPPPSAPPPPEATVLADAGDTVTSGDPPKVIFSVQVASFRGEQAALDLETKLRDAGYEPHIIYGADGFYKVRVGEYPTRSETTRLAEELRRTMGGNPFVVETP